MKAWLTGLVAACCTIVPAGLAPAAPILLDNMPAYNWYHGCGPTAAGSIVGYWDLAGLPNLFDASGPTIYLTANVQDQISSPEHNAKYDPDPDDPNLPVPVKTSIADWFKTSVNLPYGWSYQSDAPAAFTGYFGYRGYTASSGWTFYDASSSWSSFTNQINKGAPVMFLVDSTGDGGTDHFVPVFGYDDRGAGGLWYACYDTWSEGETVRWKQFRAMSSSYSWGVGCITTISAPFFWKVSGAGQWNNSSNWTGAIPSTPNDSAWIDGANNINVSLNTSVNLQNVYVGWHRTGTLTQVAGSNLSAAALKIGQYAGSSGVYELASGGLSVGELSIGNAGSAVMRVTGASLTMSVSSRFRIGAAGRFEAAPGTTLAMTGTSFQNFATDPAAAAGLEQLRVIVQGGVVNRCNLEAAGRDVGGTTGGFQNNFALAVLTLGGADIGSVRLVNDFNNNPSSGGTDAIYVTELNLLSGARLDLNGLRLYFLRNGAPCLLLAGDYNLDGWVSADDYAAWFNHYSGSGGWADGDWNGDGVVDATDYSFWFNNYGASGGSFSVPEPVTGGWLILVGLAMFRRRSKAKNGD